MIVSKTTEIPMDDIHFAIRMLLKHKKVDMNHNAKDIKLSLKNGTVDESRIELTTSIIVSWNEESEE